MEVLWRWCCIAGGITAIMRRRGVTCKKVRDGIPTTHLHMDLDWERDSLLQVFGFLIEVLAELPDGDSSLDGR